MTPPLPVPILLTVRELDQGGIERDIARIATHLDRSRFEPHVASYFSHGIRYQELRRAGVPLLHLPVRTFASPRILRHAWTLGRYIRRHRIQLVHSWDTSGVFAIPIARLAGVPVVISSLLGSRALLDPRSRRQWRFTDRMVDAVIVNCDAMRRHLIEEEGARGTRCELCYNGVDTSVFYPLPRPKIAEVDRAPLVIGAVCALRPEKALHLLQQAFARVRELCPEMKLLLVGSGTELARLRAGAAQLGIASGTVFVPATADVARYLRSIDIFVSCSISEAFSNALLEAMACGCCVVGSRVGGTPEMIGETEERGLLFPSGDVAQLARRLALLIENPSLRQQMARRAADFARDHLNLETNLNRTAAIYESLLREAGLASRP